MLNMIYVIKSFYACDLESSCILKLYVVHNRIVKINKQEAIVNFKCAYNSSVSLHSVYLSGSFVVIVSTLCIDTKM